jgi:hypothetical protein
MQNRSLNKCGSCMTASPILSGWTSFVRVGAFSYKLVRWNFARRTILYSLTAFTSSNVWCLLMNSDYLLLCNFFSLYESHVFIMSTQKKRTQTMWKKERRGHEWSIQIKVVIRTTSTSNQEPIKQPELVDCNHIDRNLMKWEAKACLVLVETI